MTPEPLKGKRYQESDDINFYDVKSAVEGLIKFHEDRIGELIHDYEKENFRPTTQDIIWDEIKGEYESIMAIEYWLEDVV